jgi:hypothetical protein
MSRSRHFPASSDVSSAFHFMESMAATDVTEELTWSERLRGCLDAAKLSEVWIAGTQKCALVLEARDTTHIEGLSLRLNNRKAFSLAAAGRLAAAGGLPPLEASIVLCQTRSKRNLKKPANALSAPHFPQESLADSLIYISAGPNAVRAASRRCCSTLFSCSSARPARCQKSVDSSLTSVAAATARARQSAHFP